MDEVRPLVQLVSPFAPHIAEELWELVGGSGSVFDAGWPQFDAVLVTEDQIEMPVQVNGKRRGAIMGRKDIAQADAVAAAMADPAIAKFVTGDPKKIVFVAGRLLNLVV